MKKRMESLQQAVDRVLDNEAVRFVIGVFVVLPFCFLVAVPVAAYEFSCWLVFPLIHPEKFLKREQPVINWTKPPL